MNKRIYTYRNSKLKTAEKNLEFRKNNYHFLSKLSESFEEVKDGEDVGDKMIDFLHNEENLRMLFQTFLEKDSSEKIDFDFSNDENYEAVLSLAGRILKDFFLTKARYQKRLKN